MSASSSSSKTSVSFTSDKLQLREARRQKLAAKLQKYDDKVKTRRAEMEARRRQARHDHYSSHRVDEDDEGPIKPVTKRKRVFGQSSESEDEEMPAAKKRAVAFSENPSSETEFEEVILPNEPSTSSDAEQSFTCSPTPSVSSLVSLLSLTSLESLSSSAPSPPPTALPSPPVTAPRRGRPKKKVCTRARDASGRFLPGPTRTGPIVKRKRRTELEMLVEYPL